MSDRRPISVRARFETFKRDGFRCVYCGRRAPAVEIQIDHVVPVSQGGSHEPSNFVTACKDCNSGKSDVSLSGADSPTEKLRALLRAEGADVHLRVWEEDETRTIRQHWARVYGYEHDYLTLPTLQHFIHSLRRDAIADAIEVTRKSEDRDIYGPWSDDRRFVTFCLLCQALVRSEGFEG